MPVYDRLTKEQRSERMSRIRGKDTSPEMRVRKLLTALGFRYRLHVASLPGKPDIVFTRKRKVIFVHGCFWHLHSCSKYKLPKTRTTFWSEKLASNVRRDKENCRGLRKAGWKVLIIWECQLTTSQLAKTNKKLIKFLSPQGDAS